MVLVDKNKERLVTIIDRLGLGLLGALCLLYVLFGSNIAERHIQFSFLDFPLFIGEQVLFLCMVLFLMRIRLVNLKNELSVFIILGYFVFVGIKVVLGYWNWGPLALRDGVLFFYPIAAVFTYFFFDRSLLEKKYWFLTLFALILGIFLYRKFYEYWVLTLFYLGGICVLLFPSKKMRIFLVIILCSLTPISFLWKTSRMMILGNTISLLTVLIMFFLVVRMPVKIRTAWLAGFLLMITLGMYSFSNHKYVISIFKFEKMYKMLKDYEYEIALKKESVSLSENRKVKLFNPNDAEESSIASIHEEFNSPTNFLNVSHDGFNSLLESSTWGNISRFKKHNIKMIFIKVEDRLDNLQGWASGEASSLGLRQELLDLSNEYKKIYRVFELNHFVAAYVPKGVTLRLAKLFDRLLSLEMERLRTVYDGGSVPVQVAEAEEAPEIKESVFDPGSVSNAVFRLFIWRDMIREFGKVKPVLGFDFGKPFRSESLEFLRWGESEWGRDGWVAAHNSYLNIIFRTGAVGVMLVMGILIFLKRAIVSVVSARSVVGILLIGSLIVWVVAANFLVILEVPYTAIPIWCLVGLTCVYLKQLKLKTTEQIKR